MKRLTIYAFYDPAGRVDDYVVDCVEAMAAHSERVLVVSNGPVEAPSADRLTALASVELVERANEGFDIWGYKHGLESVGWDSIARYDEVVLMNSTIAGPLYPLAEMFDAMEVRDVDFWGLTAHAGEEFDPWELLPTGRIEPHLQSFFTAVRRRMLHSPEFRRYWESLPQIRSYTEAVALHEAVFTERFAALGFRWASYVDSSDLERVISYPLMFLPQQVLIGKRCPFFKRKALLLAPDDLAATRATSSLTTVECVRRLGYDLGRILPNVIRTSHQSDVRLSLNAFTVLDASSADATSADATSADSTRADTALASVRVVARVKDLPSCLALERCAEVIAHCRETVIVSDGDEETEVLERLKRFGARIEHSGFAGFLEEVGRAAKTDEHVLILGSAGGFSDNHGLAAYAHYEMGAVALAGSTERLAAALACVEASDVIGALAAPLSNLGLLTSKRVMEELTAVLHGLGLSVPLSDEKPAWGPPSGAVLAGPGMLDTDWGAIADAAGQLADDDAEELFTALIPFLLQGRGRILGFALPADMASSAALIEYLRTGQAASAAAQRDERSRRLRPAHVYHNTGDGYSEDLVTRVYPKRTADGRVLFAWKAPDGVMSVRFDPVEHCGVVCRDVAATVDGVHADIVPVNSLRFDAALDVFMTTDPIYDLRGVTSGADVAVTMASVAYIDAADFIPSDSADGVSNYGKPLTLALTEVQQTLAETRLALNVTEAFRARVEATYWWRARRKLARLRRMLARMRNHLAQN